MQEIALALAIGLALACVFGGTIICIVWIERQTEPRKRPTAQDILDKQRRKR